MNWDRIEGNWKQFSGKAREKWGKLTDSDWQTIGGKKDQLVGRLQERYGIEKDQASRDADTWAQSLQDADEAPRTGTAGRY
ncbi:MAG TPA: PqqD family peptide modification chaperone [Bryobacteraceae bacterium]|jgi:uncharacterized protein YjbJ (UPF0337 family)|nr:PqqD family peptide modification chaperone [Bryobacteraceae bacterium]